MLIFQLVIVGLYLLVRAIVGRRDDRQRHKDVNGARAHKKEQCVEWIRVAVETHHVAVLCVKGELDGEGDEQSEQPDGQNGHEEAEIGGVEAFEHDRIVDGQIAVQGEYGDRIGLNALYYGPNIFADVTQSAMITKIAPNRHKLVSLAQKAHQEQREQEAAKVGMMQIEEVLFLHLFDEENGEKVQQMNEKSRQANYEVEYIEKLVQFDWHNIVS